ncbi:uncharacterized protein MELLADRAFT_114346 [Melampsora larici-populina 98AG31]|uniref:Uncharacterized protein n=1 Tax=Melampsora larici-populina (strain 98AG31 / pathotype 3-4-7) TaxID=747676 RepID=F4SD47_MELLP|nr:uncharacterized protein MELLADRAFT_114346 [Melampsora larici-populina 98AG31]EGF97420.1 hypothetical protein MELLADRAFT_114346 [Melampsora larici-populina 98AG31]
MIQAIKQAEEKKKALEEKAKEQAEGRRKRAESRAPLAGGSQEGMSRSMDGPTGSQETGSAPLTSAEIVAIKMEMAEGSLEKINEEDGHQEAEEGKGSGERGENSSSGDSSGDDEVVKGKAFEALIEKDQVPRGQGKVSTKPIPKLTKKVEADPRPLIDRLAEALEMGRDEELEELRREFREKTSDINRNGKEKRKEEGEGRKKGKEKMRKKEKAQDKRHSGDYAQSHDNRTREIIHQLTYPAPRPTPPIAIHLSDPELVTVVGFEEAVE